MRALAALTALLGSALLTACASPGLTDAERQTLGADRGDIIAADFTAPEITSAAQDWLGVPAETMASVVERVFADLGEPNAYIYGGEGGAAIVAGVRYGEGTLVTKSGGSRKVFWQGPSIGFDVGGNAAQTFTLVYNLPDAESLFRRYPGVEGSAYFVGGVGVNYQQAGDTILVPMRAGVGFRTGANVGYLTYSRQRNILPL